MTQAEKLAAKEEEIASRMRQALRDPPSNFLFHGKELYRRGDSSPFMVFAEEILGIYERGYRLFVRFDHKTVEVKGLQGAAF